MVTHEPTTSLLRFYAGEHPGPWEPYVAVCTLIWEAEQVVWVAGLHGALSRPLMRELVECLASMGVRLVKAHRDPARNLPLAAPVGDHLEIDIERAIEFLKQRDSSA